MEGDGKKGEGDGKKGEGDVKKGDVNTDFPVELFTSLFSALAPKSAPSAEGPKLGGSVGWIFKAWGSNSQGTWNVEIKNHTDSTGEVSKLIDPEPKVGVDKNLLGVDLEVVKGWGRRGERTPSVGVTIPKKKMLEEKSIGAIDLNPMAVRVPLPRACKYKIGKEASVDFDGNLQCVPDASVKSGMEVKAQVVKNSKAKERGVVIREPKSQEVTLKKHVEGKGKAKIGYVVVDKSYEVPSSGWGRTKTRRSGVEKGISSGVGKEASVDFDGNLQCVLDASIKSGMEVKAQVMKNSKAKERGVVIREPKSQEVTLKEHVEGKGKAKIGYVVVDKSYEVPSSGWGRTKTRRSGVEKVKKEISISSVAVAASASSTPQVEETDDSKKKEGDSNEAAAMALVMLSEQEEESKGSKGPKS